MDDALDDVERFTDHPLPAASDAAAVAAWAKEAQVKRLATARAMSAAAHADLLPPEQANQVSAKLVVGVKMLRDVAREMKLPESRQALIDALLFKAQQQARNVHHNGMAPSHVAALEFAPLTRGAARTVSELNHDGSAFRPREVVATGKVDSEPQQWGVMAHESVHEGQYSVELGDHYPRTPTHPEPPDHARPGFLAVQRSLPFWGWEDKPAPPRGHPLFFEHYRTNPLETQAFWEQSHVAVLVADRAGATGRDKQVDRVVRQTLQWVLKASQQLGTDVDVSAQQPVRGVTVLPQEKRRRYEATHAESYEHVARMVGALVDLAAAAKSRGWTQALGERTAKAVVDKSIEWGLSGLDGRAGIKALAELLNAQLQDLTGPGGVTLGRADRAAPDAAEFARFREQPVAVAAQQIAYLNAGTRLFPAALQSALTQSVQASGFVPLLQEVADPAKTAVQREQAVARAVMGLAEQLLGAEPGSIPPVAVHLFDAPSVLLPQVAGMNEHGAQTRKPVFERGTWQVHVPAHTLNDPRKLAPRVARLAYNVAHAADLHRRGKVDAMEVHDGGGRFTRQIGELLHETRPPDAGRQANEPTVAANALAAVTLRHSNHLSVSLPERLFHEGPRAELKQAAAQGDTASREHYETHAFARWQSPGVALRRALVAVAADMARQTPVAADSVAAVRAPPET